jgi:nickel-dependent lactate racemase
MRALSFTAPAPGEVRFVTTPDHGRPSLGVDEIREAVERPLGKETPFAADYREGEQITIVVPDVTRAAAVDLYLPVLLEKIRQQGVSDRYVTILFANGTHPPMHDMQRARIVGPQIIKQYRCLDHDCDNAPFAAVFVPGRGETVHLNRLAIECDRLIVTGAVGMHYLAGFGGGRKLLMPGIASREDASRFHQLCLDDINPGRHPSVGPGKVEGNRMSDYAWGVARAVKIDFALNTVIAIAPVKSTDSDTAAILGHGKPVAVFAGEMEAAFAAGCKIAHSVGTASIEQPGDLVIASTGGFRKDITFIQAHKAYDNAAQACAPGGKIFLMAECADGIGNDQFMAWMQKGSSEAIETALRYEFVINGHTAMATREKSERFDTTLWSVLDPAEVRAMGMTPISSLDEFRDAIITAVASAKEMVIIPDAGYVTPVVVNR